jgi:hypothetical protein
LSLEGEVVSDVTIKPKRIRFRDLKKSEKAFREVSITLRNPDKVKISSVTIENNDFEVLHKSSDPKKGAQYEVVFHGSAKLGIISTTMRIFVQGLEKPYRDIPVEAHISGNLRYSKKMFFFNKSEVFPSKKIVISTRDGAPVTIKKVDDPDKLLKLKIEKNSEPTVHIQAQVAKPSIKYDSKAEHKLIIQTSDKDEPTVEIAYRIGGGRPSTFRRNVLKRKSSLGKRPYEKK